MSEVLWKSLELSAGGLGVALVLASSVHSAEPPTVGATLEKVAALNQSVLSLKQNTQQSNTLAQVTSVSELSDVQPTDWTFQALQSLAERYACMSGYSEGSDWGQRSLTRYEFAMGLHTCLDRYNELTAKTTADLMWPEDLATLQRLQREFAPDLASLREPVADLEARTTELEAQQFSATTRLTGEAIFAVSGVVGGNQVNDDGERIDRNLSFGNRLRLSFDTSFTGEDRLRTRIQTTNAPRLGDAVGTDMARLSFQGDDENKFELSRLEYRFPVVEPATIYIETVGGSLDDFTDTLNALSSSGRGSISRFGQRNPIYRQSPGTGVGLSYDFGETASLSFGYLGTGSEPEEDDAESEAARSPYGIIAQLTLQPNEAVGLGLTYVRSLNSLDTGTGSELANDPFDNQSDRITANSYGLEATVEVTSRFTLGGWVGYTEARAEDLAGEPKASIFNYAVTLAFPDLGKEDNLAGIVIGQPPRVTGNGLGRDFQDEDISLHLEAFYRFQATDNIAITPGVLVITSPEHNNSNDTVYVGTVRTTFTF